MSNPIIRKHERLDEVLIVLTVISLLGFGLYRDMDKKIGDSTIRGELKAGAVKDNISLQRKGKRKIYQISDDGIVYARFGVAQ